MLCLWVNTHTHRHTHTSYNRPISCVDQVWTPYSIRCWLVYLRHERQYLIFLVTAHTYATCHYIYSQQQTLLQCKGQGCVDLTKCSFLDVFIIYSSTSDSELPWHLPADHGPSTLLLYSLSLGCLQHYVHM